MFCQEKSSTLGLFSVKVKVRPKGYLGLSSKAIRLGSANKLYLQLNDEDVNDLSSSYLSEDSDSGISVHSNDVEWPRCGNNLDRQSLV